MGWKHCWCRHSAVAAHPKHSNNARNFIIATHLFGILSLYYYYYYYYRSLEARVRYFILLPISLLLHISIELTYHVYFDELKFRCMSYSWDFQSQIFRCNVRIYSMSRKCVTVVNKKCDGLYPKSSRFDVEKRLFLSIILDWALLRKVIECVSAFYLTYDCN